LRHAAVRKLELAMTDLILAILHHTLVFGLAGVLAAEIAMMRPGLTLVGLKRLAIVDAHYGALAGLIIVVGILRVVYGIKGPDAYLPNVFFWAKMAAFAAVALLSIAPTVRIVAWRRKAKVDPAFCPFEEEVKRVRGFLLAEAAVFVLIPVFAAVMARGYGLPQ
jgi:putative membrane protein